MSDVTFLCRYSAHKLYNTWALNCSLTVLNRAQTTAAETDCLRVTSLQSLFCHSPVRRWQPSLSA